MNKIPDGAVVEDVLVAPLGEWNAGDDTELPPPRAWLLGNVFARCFVSSIFADGGVGKTAVRLAQYLSLATGIPLTGEHVFQRCRVLIVCLEDDDNELRRRVLAVRKHHGISLDQVNNWLWLAAPGRAAGKLMTQNEKGLRSPGKLAANIEVVIKHRQIDIVCLDPFVKTHSVPENNNDAIDEVAQLLFELASKYNIAVDVPHHISKGQADPGNADRGRGASALKDAGRLMYTLAPMSSEEAKTFGITEEKRPYYIRMDKAKVNIVPPMRLAKWFRLVGVDLGNATPLYPHGDNVQTVEPWTPPELWSNTDADLLNRILDDIDKGLDDGIRYSDAGPAKARAAWKVVTKHAPDKTEEQAREMIRTWVSDGVLVARDYMDRDRGEEVKGLYVEPGKRPSAPPF